MCGGAAGVFGVGEQSMGLSPRVRGSPDVYRHVHRTRRSIPACAGEPEPRCRVKVEIEVYPRVCGGASPFALARTARKGLSPRVRGSRFHVRIESTPSRSIPACAGEPVSYMSGADAMKVYPRVCGGASRLSSCPRTVFGLSPRVRGSRRQNQKGIHLVRSIPACAGEPSPCPSSSAPTWVYPRVCGGAGRLGLGIGAGRGLSPRVRGSPRDGQAPHVHRGSIPACAGEPRRRWRR